MQNGCKWNMKSYSFLSDEWSFRLLEIISRTSIDYMEAMMQRKLAPDLQSSWAKNDLKSFPHIFRFRGVIQKISYVWWGYSSLSVSMRLRRNYFCMNSPCNEEYVPRSWPFVLLMIHLGSKTSPANYIKLLEVRTITRHVIQWYIPSLETLHVDSQDPQCRDCRGYNSLLRGPSMVWRWASGHVETPNMGSQLGQPQKSWESQKVIVTIHGSTRW